MTEKEEGIFHEKDADKNFGLFDLGYAQCKKDLKAVLDKKITMHGKSEIDKGLAVSAITAERNRIKKEFRL